MTASPRIVEVRQNILKHNDQVARALTLALQGCRHIRGQPGLESGLRQDGISGKDAYAAEATIPACCACRRFGDG